jgi:hypothetical protein
LFITGKSGRLMGHCLPESLPRYSQALVPPLIMLVNGTSSSQTSQIFNW